jgi:hypothetical protein
LFFNHNSIQSSIFVLYFTFNFAWFGEQWEVEKITVRTTAVINLADGQFEKDEN